MPERSPVTRRRFLTGTGTVGLLLAGSNLLPGSALADPIAGQAGPPLTGLAKALEDLSLDTARGIAAMIMPGPDPWSLQQGTPRVEAGHADIRLGEFVKDVLDNYLAAGDQLARPLALNIAQGLEANGVDVAPFLGVSEEQARRIDEALGYEFNDKTLPLSVPVALLLNLLALGIAPNTIVGPLASPFSRLSLDHKTRVFAQIEGPVVDLASQVDDALPEPIKGSAAGLLQFLGGAVLEVTSFGAYSETDLYDRTTKTLASRPIPWDLVRYRTERVSSANNFGLTEGQDDFLGYYQNRTEIPADA